jgi:hypothetical protein
MSESAEKKVGWPLWAKALVALFVLVVIVRSCDDSDTPATRTAPVQQREATAAAAAQREKAEAERLKQECASTVEAKKLEYAALQKQKKHWDAALVVRACADSLASQELAKLVREAEVASHMADINNPKMPPRDRARAMQMLARDYPDIGAKYEPQAAKLLEVADRLDADAEKRRKRSQGVRVGMTKEDVLASSWGRPESVNTTTTVHGTREQWVYGSGNYLYFENGVLTAIQN